MTNDKIFSDVKLFGLIFIPVNWVICALVTVILIFTTSKPIYLGYLLGSITSFLTFGLMMKNVTNTTTTKTKASPFRQALSGSLVRLLLQAVVVGFAIYDDSVNVIATIIGLMVLKVVLIPFVIIRYRFFKEKEVTDE